MTDETQLMEELKALPPTHRIAFAASCCERLLPLYEAFQKTEGWGNYGRLRSFLDFIWESLSVDVRPDEAEVRMFMDECHNYVPDAEEFTGVFVPGAQGAGISIYYSLESLITEEPILAIYASRHSYGSIVSYLEQVSDPDLDYHASEPILYSWVQESPLLLGEKQKQKQDIVKLKSVAKLDADFIGELKNSSSLIGINPFRRQLLKK